MLVRIVPTGFSLFAPGVKHTAAGRRLKAPARAVHLWTMRCAHRPACRGQRFALPTTQTFDHNYTASYYLHELRTPESYRGDNYSDAGGARAPTITLATIPSIRPSHNGPGTSPASRSLQETHTHDPHGPATFRSFRQDRPRHRRLARPRAATCPGAGRSGREDHADIPQGGRSGRVRRHAAGRRHRRALDRRRLRAGGRHPAPRAGNAAAHGRYRYPREQRGRQLGRSCRRPSHRGVGQGHEPQRARLLSAVAGHCQAQHDPAQERPHHQRGLHRRAGRQPHPDENHCLQHLQGRRDQLHACAGGGVGRPRYQCQRHLPGLLQDQDGLRAHRDPGRAENGRARAAAPPGRRGRPQGAVPALRLGRRQAHHRSVDGRRWRRQRGDRG